MHYDKVLHEVEVAIADNTSFQDKEEERISDCMGALSNLNVLR